LDYVFHYVDLEVIIMKLIEQIKQQQIAARKAGSTEASLLTTLLGEAAMVGKNAGRETTDQEVIAVVKKFIKNIDETVSALTSRGQDAASFLSERSVLERFLPLQLTEIVLEKIAQNHKSMPEFMKFLKEKHAGQYDGKLASTVAKKIYK
jgi:uncharacterized protein YqeY